VGSKTSSKVVLISYQKLGPQGEKQTAVTVRASQGERGYSTFVKSWREI